MIKGYIVFDMDGTIADLYGVENWLEMLRAEDDTPYKVAKPLYYMEELNLVLNQLKEIGYKVAVTSWLSMGGSEEYNAKVRKAKTEWLDRYGFPNDELHLVKYGTTKANCTRGKCKNQILVDDNEKVRKGWNLGLTINAKDDNIIVELMKLYTS